MLSHHALDDLADGQAVRVYMTGDVEAGEGAARHAGSAVAPLAGLDQRPRKPVAATQRAEQVARAR